MYAPRIVVVSRPHLTGVEEIFEIFSRMCRLRCYLTKILSFKFCRKRGWIRQAFS